MARIPITLRRLAPAPVVSFALPIARAEAAESVAVSVAGAPIPVTARPLLHWIDPDGLSAGWRSALIQFDAALMPADTLTIVVETSTHGAPIATGFEDDFERVSHPISVTAAVADWTLQLDQAGQYRFVAENPRRLTLFDSREPSTIAVFPEGYLAGSGLFGPLISRAELLADPALAGVRYLSDAFGPCVRSALYFDEWPTQASSIAVPLPFEGYLYDRALTILLALAHTGEELFLRPAYQYAWSYGSQIALSGTYRGYWSGKGSWDSKYSHARGLFAYYGLTGDDDALEALRAIGDLWTDDPYFSVPYQNGVIRGWDKLWTERLLGTALEGTWYAYAATGAVSYLEAFRRLLGTAHRHVTTREQAELDAIIKPYVGAGGLVYRFPPQDAFVHNALQASEGNATDPWCSGWMIELLLDPLLAYRAWSADPRVDEILIRLGRFLRDTGTTYLSRAGMLFDDFLNPATPYDPQAPPTIRRRVIPQYGSGRRMDGTRFNGGEYSDYEHVPDTTGLTAASWAAFARAEAAGAPATPIGPFESELACAGALHEEYSVSAQISLFVRDGWIYRDPRQPAGTFHTQGRIAMSVGGDPTKFAEYIARYGVGQPRWAISPQRKLSWWFNSSILQFGLLREVGLAVPVARAGFLQPGAPPPPPPNRPPVVALAGPYRLDEGAELRLEATAVDPDDPIGTLVWNFGDGSPLFYGGLVALHTYEQAGRFQVTVSAIDPHGATGSASAEVLVSPRPVNIPPLVDAGGPYTVVEGEELVFAGVATDADGDPLVVSWDFGDGSPPSAELTARNTYTWPGQYVATLTAWDGRGGRASDTAEVAVVSPPPTVEELLAQIAALEAMLRAAADQTRALELQVEALTRQVDALTYDNGRLHNRITAARAALEGP